MGCWGSCCSFLRRLQTGVAYTVRRYPSTVLAPLFLFFTLCACGIVAVILASNASANTAKSQAQLDAAAAAEIMRESMQAMIQPTYSMGMYIQAHPYYPDVENAFPNLTKSLLDQVQRMDPGSSYSSLELSSYLELAPMANISSVYPVNANSSSSVGLDLLVDPRIAHYIGQAPGHRLTLEGPIMLYGEQVWGMIGSVTVFVENVERNETFGMPDYLPKECPEDITPLCYDEATGSKFWGLVYSVIYFDSFISGPTAALNSLRDKGYSYLLFTSYTVDDPPLTPGFKAPNGSYATLLAQSPEELMPDAVQVTIDVLGVSMFSPWVLLVTKSSGWVPAWKYPLLAGVIIVAAIIAVLLFILLLYMRQHQSLLYALMPRHLVQSMFQADAFEAIVQSKDSRRPEEPRMLNAGTPVERLIDMLSQLMMGRDPNMQEVVALRAAVIQGGDMLFEPQNLRGQLQFNKALEDDVVDALVRELQGLNYANMPGVNRSNTGRPKDKRPGSCSSYSLPDDDALGQLSVALTFITNEPRPGKEHPPLGLAKDLFVDESNMMRSVKEQIPPAIQHPLLPNDPQSCPTDQVEAFLEAAYGSWSFDAFQFTEATNGHPLSTMFFFLLSRSGLIRDMKLEGSTVARLALALEDGYHQNPYHNKAHAADVLQTMHTILLHAGMVVAAGENGYCPPLTLLACLLAAAGHDIGHTGVTNDFLIQNEDQLAILYSDKSPMEHHHLAHLWTLLKNPSYNILRHFKKEDKLKVRKTVIDLICATDMKSHFSILSQFSISHRLSGATGPAAPSARSSSTGSPSMGTHTSSVAVNLSSSVPTDEAERMTSLQVVLKCADLGHIAETLEVHRRWVTCLEEEFFAQGDRERALGLPISPLFDRNKPGASKSQVGFCDFVVLPLFHNFTCAFPGAKPLTDLALHTYKFWKSTSPGADT